MTAVELAALIVTLVCMVTVALLAFAVVSLARTLKELRHVVADLQKKALPLVNDLRDTADRAEAELGRVDQVIERAEKISVTVDSASRLAYKAFSPPLIKGLSLMSGIGQAARRLRARRRARKTRRSRRGTRAQ